MDMYLKVWLAMLWLIVNEAHRSEGHTAIVLYNYKYETVAMILLTIF